MNSAIIVAAGQGIRMGGRASKQFLPLAGKPILSRTLQVFTASGLFHEIILVIAASDEAYCRRLLGDTLGMKTEVRLVAGGRDRQASVFNGLKACRGKDDDLVLIHDGVRPLVTAECLAQCLDVVGAQNACIVAVPASDTLKAVGPDGRIARTLSRDNIWMAQTPQCFRLGIIRAAHHDARANGFSGTDDAQLVERMGQSVAIVPGNRGNIKITTPDDLRLAETLWQQARIGRPQD